MRVKYFILKGKSDYPSIHVRFWDSNRIDQKTKTGLKVYRDHWNPNRERVRTKVDSRAKDFINNSLEHLSRHIADEYIIDSNSKIYISTNWLKGKVETYFGNYQKKSDLHKQYFVEWIERYTDNAKDKLYRGKCISERTIKHYKTTIKKIKAFENNQKVKLRHEDINLNFYRKWIIYLRKVEMLNDNSIGGYIGNIKMWAKNIEIEGLPISKEYKHSEFMVITSKTYDIYLSEKEIELIRDHKLQNSTRLKNVQDLFLIGLRTGLRISDFMRLTKFNFKDDQIIITTKKTNQEVIIPLHKDIKDIIKQNQGLPRPISNQKFNLYVKELCKKVGLNQMVQGAKMVKEEIGNGQYITRKKEGRYHKYELISSHTCRRSFATNLYGKIPNMTIMAITGHKTESQFLKYLKTSKQEHADKLKELWKK